jgi:hypothetical protein
MKGQAIPGEKSRRNFDNEEGHSESRINPTVSLDILLNNDNVLSLITPIT